MKSKKLTSNHREIIARKILKNKKHEAEKSMKAWQEKWFKKVYDKLYTKSEIEWMSKAPKGFLAESRCFRVKLNSEIVEVQAGKDETGNFEYFPISNDHCGYGTVAIIEDLMLKQQAKKMLEEYRCALSCKAEVKDIEREVRTLLFSVNTSKQLVDAWPEIKDVVDDVVGETEKENLPVPAVTVLNNKLNLSGVVEGE